MKNEVEYQRAVILELEAAGFEVQPHNDKVSSFIPDLSFAGHGFDGWIELKWCNEDLDSLGSIKHYTLGQEEWMTRVGKAGSGNCFLWIGGETIPHCIFRSKYLNGIRGHSFITAVSFASALGNDLKSVVLDFIRILEQRL